MSDPVADQLIAARARAESLRAIFAEAVAYLDRWRAGYGNGEVLDAEDFRAAAGAWAPEADTVKAIADDMLKLTCELRSRSPWCSCGCK